MTHNTAFKIDGYTFCGITRAEKSGGVGILVRDDIKHIVTPHEPIKEGILVRDDIKHIVTPHEPIKEVQMFWVSIQRKNDLPIFCGVYYGKQESRTSLSQITLEMDNLTEEILDKSREGEILIFMDGNAKIGILDECISRNGRLLLQVAEECDLEFINLSPLCTGKVTRVNRNRPSERSAIDFVLSSQGTTSCITEMVIDEEEKFLLTGKKSTDHNSIILKMKMGSCDKKAPQQKVTKWRLSAPTECWDEFQRKLEELSHFSVELIENPENDIDENYGEWTKEIETIALNTIGKTTFRANRRQKESKELQSLRKEKRESKKAFEKETDDVLKKMKLDLYIDKQKEVREQIESDNRDKVQKRFEKMAAEEHGFWNLCREQSKDVMNDWSAVKDEQGIKGY